MLCYFPAINGMLVTWICTLFGHLAQTGFFNHTSVSLCIFLSYLKMKGIHPLYVFLLCFKKFCSLFGLLSFVTPLFP